MSQYTVNLHLTPDMHKMYVYHLCYCLQSLLLLLHKNQFSSSPKTSQQSVRKPYCPLLVFNSPCISTYLSILLSFYLTVYLSFHPEKKISVFLSIYISFFPLYSDIILYFYLSIYLSFYPEILILIFNFLYIAFYTNYKGIQSLPQTLIF